MARGGRSGGRGVRGRGRSSRPSPFTMERSLKRPSDAHGYYFGWNGTAYTAEEYKPEFSDGRVTDSEVNELLQELNANKHSDPVFCPMELWLVPLIMGCVGASIAIIASNMIQSTRSYSGTYVSTGTIPDTSAIIGMVLMGILGLVGICCVCVYAYKRAEKYMLLRLYHNHQVIEKHKSSVFGPKDCTLKMSTHQAYVIIEFNWKPRPAFAMVPQGYALVPTGGAGMIFPGVGTNPYQPVQMGDAAFGNTSAMYNQPPPAFS